MEEIKMEKNYNEETIIKIGVDGANIEDFFKASVFVSKWIYSVKSSEELKFLKGTLEFIEKRTLDKMFPEHTEEVRDSFFEVCRAFSTLFNLIDDEIAITKYFNEYDNEVCMQNEIADNFNSLFPNYVLLEREKKVSNGRIDIFAKDKETGRDVIIELKKACGTNPTKQLKAYSKDFTNPILIAITESKVKNRDTEAITYYTYNKKKQTIELY